MDIKFKVTEDMQPELSHVMACALAALNFVIDNDRAWAAFADNAGELTEGGDGEWDEAVRDSMREYREVLMHMYVGLDHAMGHPVFTETICPAGRH